MKFEVVFEEMALLWAVRNPFFHRKGGFRIVVQLVKTLLVATDKNTVIPSPKDEGTFLTQFRGVECDFLMRQSPSDPTEPKREPAINLLAQCQTEKLFNAVFFFSHEFWLFPVWTFFW